MAGTSQTSTIVAFLSCSRGSDRLADVPEKVDGRAATYQVSWGLHRAGEILHQISEAIASAHQAESRITYAHCDFPAFADTPHRTADHGLPL